MCQRKRKRKRRGSTTHLYTTLSTVFIGMYQHCQQKSEEQYKQKRDKAAAAASNRPLAGCEAGSGADAVNDSVEIHMKGCSHCGSRTVKSLSGQVFRS